MTTRPLDLERFIEDRPDPGGAFGLLAGPGTDAEMAGKAGEDRLAAFESGYTAGWEDAVNAEAADQTRIRADLARNLQALSFTYVEARAHVLRALEPLLHDMVAKVLPAAARVHLGGILAETLLPLAHQLGEAPIRIEINPSVRAAVEPELLRCALPVELIDEPTLTEGQAFLRMGDIARNIDLDGAVAAIGAALAGIMAPQTATRDEDRKHG